MELLSSGGGRKAGRMKRAEVEEREGGMGRERRQRYRLRNHSTASKVGAKLLATACVCMCVFCVDAIAKKSNSETKVKLTGAAAEKLTLVEPKPIGRVLLLHHRLSALADADADADAADEMKLNLENGPSAVRMQPYLC